MTGPTARKLIDHWDYYEAVPCSVEVWIESEAEAVSGRVKDVEPLEGYHTVRYEFDCGEYSYLLEVDTGGRTHDLLRYERGRDYSKVGTTVRNVAGPRSSDIEISVTTETSET